MRRSVYIIVCVAVFVLSSSASPATQKSCAGIQGRLTTVEGWMIPYVTIRAVNKSNKQIATVQTNPDGEYSLCLAPGTYTIFATASGFKSTKRKAVKINGTSKAIIDFTLKRGKPMTSH